MAAVETTPLVNTEQAPAESQSLMSVRLQDLWRMLRENPKMLAGVCIVAFFILLALIGPLFIHSDPNAITHDTLLPPSAAHWLGTTQNGQDVLIQLIIGTRSSVLWGLASGAAVTLLSITIGLSSGYFGGAIDDVLSMLTNVFLVIPGLPLSIVLAAFLPFKGSLTVALVITVTSWAWGARVLRSQTLSMRNREFVESARMSGEYTWRIIFVEILPNEIAIVASGFIGTMLYVILASASLEFLGLGDATNVTWGSMFFWAQNSDALLLGAWWWFVAPGFCIAALGAGLALMNFGIDEIANPKLRSEKGFRKLQKYLKLKAHA
jgi:peptide/nickel transport system permease protein